MKTPCIEYIFYECWLQGKYHIAPNVTLENKHFKSNSIENLYQKIDNQDCIILKQSPIYFEDGTYSCNVRVRQQETKQKKMTKSNFVDLIIEVIENANDKEEAREGISALLENLEPIDREQFAKWGYPGDWVIPENCWD